LEDERKIWMLVIRDIQIQSFIANNDEDVYKIVLDAVKRSNPSRVGTAKAERLESMVRAAIERARSEGVTRPEDIAAFVALMFEISPKFYRQPEIAAVLADTNFPVGDRLLQLNERVSEEAWAEAETAYDAEFWFRTDG
jgi:hypothetical protein